MRLAVLLAVALSSALLAGGSQAAVVEVGSIVVRADATYSPDELPRHRRVPIEVSGFFRVHSKTGIPPRLQQVIVDLDRDSRLAPRGLSVCRPARIESATFRAARRRCRGAIVGGGQVEALVNVEGRWLRVLSPLTLFNGPRAGNGATVLAHSQPASLPGEIYVVPISVTRAGGGYRATANVPEIFNPSGTLVGARVEIGRSATSKRSPSFVTARCSDGILETRGSFTFADGTVVAGPAPKSCTPTR